MVRSRSLRRAAAVRGAAVELRLLDATRARAIRARTPLPGDRWADGYPTDADAEVAAKLLRELEQGVFAGAFGLYEVLDPSRGIVVGGIGFHGPPDRDGAVEVGYGIAEAEAGHGFATAALRAAIAIAAGEGARLAFGRALPANVASRRVLEKNGFLFEGISDGFACYRLSFAEPATSETPVAT
jgi:RimJ/RimL family protein N-acetyltransferase